MNRMLRWSLWIAAGLATLVIAVVIGAWFYAQTDHFRTLLREQALSAVRDSVNGEVRFERITGSVWRQLQFHDISVRQDDIEVIFIPRLIVEVSLLRQALSLIVSSSLHVAKIEVSDPAIKLVQDDDKQWNIASLFKISAEPEEPQKIAIFLDQIKIDGGRIDVRQADGRVVTLTSISTEGKLDLLSSAIKADVAPLKFSLAAAGIPPVQGTSAFSWEADDSGSLLKLGGLNLRTPRSQLVLSGEVRDLAKTAVTLSLRLEKVGAEEMKMLLPDLPVQQDLSGLLTISGPSSAMRINGTIRFPDGQLTTSVIGDLTQIEPHFRGTLDAKDFRLGKILSISDVAGNLNGQLSFNGKGFENAQATTRASISSFALKQWQLGDLELAGDLRNQTIALNTKLTNKNGQAWMESHVALGREPVYEAKLRVRKLDIRRVAKTGAVPMAADINLDAAVKGRGTDPNRLDGTADITILPSRLGAVEGLQGRIAGSLRQGILTLSEARLASKGTTLTAQGRISAAAKTPSGKITYVARAQEIAPWAALAGLEGKGSVQLDGSATGSLQALTLEGKANLAKINLAASAFESGTVAWSLSGVGGSQPNGSIKIDTREIQAGIALRKLETQLSFAGIEPINVQAIITAEDREKHQHRLRGRGRYSSSFADFLVEQLVLQSPSGTWKVPQPVRLQMKDKRITVNDFLLQNGTQSIGVKGIFALEGSQDVQLEVKRFPLEELKSFLATDPRVGGELNAEVELRGSAARPVLKSNARVDRLSIAGQRYAGITGEAFYQNERLTLDVTLRQDASHLLTAKGGIPLYLGWGGEKSVAVLGEADLRVRSDGLNPAFLGLISKDIEDIQGNLLLDVQLRGPANALRPTGTVELQQARARIKQLGLSPTAVEVQARLLPGVIQLTRISARSGEGQLTGGGTIGLKNYSVGTIDLTLNADDFRVVNTPEYSTAVSGRLTASGSQEQPLIRGALTLSPAKLRPNLAALQQKGPPPPDPTVMVVKNEQELAVRKSGLEPAQESGRPQDGFYRRLGLDIAVVVPRGTWVYLDEGSIELMGRLRIRKEPQEEVSLTGTVESVRGWYSFHGKQFRVEKGRVVFTGGSVVDPSLELVARYRLPQYQIDLILGGTTKKPTLTFRSEPPMEQADILSTLLFGRPVAALSEGQQTSLQAQALKTTANFVASELRQSVANRLGVDNLEFGFGESVSQARVGVGKYVTENIYVSGAQEIGGEQQQEYSVEYNIAPNWQLKGSTTARGKSGVDLFWRKQY